MTDLLYCMIVDGHDEVCGKGATSKEFVDFTEIGMRGCVPMCDKHALILAGFATAAGLEKDNSPNV